MQGPFTIAGLQLGSPLTLNTVKSLLIELGRKCRPEPVVPVFQTYQDDNMVTFSSMVDVSAMLGRPPGSAVGRAHHKSGKTTAEKEAAWSAMQLLESYQDQLLVRAGPAVDGRPGVTLLKEWCDLNGVAYQEPDCQHVGTGFVASIIDDGILFQSEVRSNKKDAKHDVCLKLFQHLSSQRKKPSLSSPSLSSPSRASQSPISPLRSADATGWPGLSSPSQLPISPPRSADATGWPGLYERPSPPSFPVRSGDDHRHHQDPVHTINETLTATNGNPFLEGYVEIVTPPGGSLPIQPPPSGPPNPETQAQAQAQVKDEPEPEGQRDPLWLVLKESGLESLYPFCQQNDVGYKEFRGLTKDDLRKFPDLTLGKQKKLEKLVQTNQGVREVKVCRTRKLGSGQSSCVFEGKMGLRRVALKQRKRKEGEKNASISAQELGVLRDTRHQNILHCYGEGRDGEERFLVFEKLHSDLTKFLQHNKMREKYPLEEHQLVRILKKVAKGMAYLHRWGYLHNDLAGRNVLVSYDLRDIKIADFELSKTIDTDDGTYKCADGLKLPRRNSAPEVLLTHCVSKKGDVWAFSMLCWEVFNHGQAPHGDLTTEKFEAMVLAKKMPLEFEDPRFENLSDEVRQLFTQSQSYNPEQRPHFELIYKTLKAEEKRLRPPFNAQEEEDNEEEAENNDNKRQDDEAEEEDEDEDDENDDEEEQEEQGVQKKAPKEGYA